MASKRKYFFQGAFRGTSLWLPKPTFLHIMRTESSHQVNRQANEIASGLAGMTSTYGGIAAARNAAVLFAAQDTHYSVSRSERVRIA